MFLFESNAIFSVIVKTTAKNIPTAPKTQPQKMSEKNTTAGERPTPCPISFGSIILLIKLLIIKYQSISQSVVLISWFKSESKRAGIEAIIEPITGIKLSKKPKSPQSIAY